MPGKVGMLIQPHYSSEQKETRQLGLSPLPRIPSSGRLWTS
jgi:hypothetical protein